MSGVALAHPAGFLDGPELLQHILVFFEFDFLLFVSGLQDVLFFFLQVPDAIIELLGVLHQFFFCFSFYLGVPQTNCVDTVDQLILLHFSLIQQPSQFFTLLPFFTQLDFQLRHLLSIPTITQLGYCPVSRCQLIRKVNDLSLSS